jgi:quercetin dioxygenase-like cupin family protein
MNLHRIEDFKGGWFIGDFEPSLFKNSVIEASVKTHKKNEEWPVHYHKKATEFNVVISGSMIIQGKELSAGDVFVLKPYEIADPTFLEDTVIVCIKIPAAKNDKFEVKQ